MKIRVRYSAEGISVDETFSGGTSEAIVTAMKQRVASEAGFAARLLIGSMSPLGFAQEVVRRYNRKTGASLPNPSSCDEFLAIGRAEGIIAVLDD